VIGSALTERRYRSFAGISHRELGGVHSKPANFDRLVAGSVCSTGILLRSMTISFHSQIAKLCSMGISLQGRVTNSARRAPFSQLLAVSAAWWLASFAWEGSCFLAPGYYCLVRRG